MELEIKIVDWSWVENLRGYIYIEYELFNSDIDIFYLIMLVLF